MRPSNDTAADASTSTAAKDLGGSAGPREVTRSGSSPESDSPILAIEPDSARQPKFRTLIGVHMPNDPPEASLVLAAVCAYSGVRLDGRAMTESGIEARQPSLRDLATELTLGVDAVRRGVRHLERVGLAKQYLDGVCLLGESALTHRSTHHRQVFRITQDMRSKGLRAWPLLLAALVQGQIGRLGYLRLGTPFLRERTGMEQRPMERALSTLRKAEVLHTWSRPTGNGGWQLHLAMGPSPANRAAIEPSGNQLGSQTEPRRVARCETSEDNGPITQPSSLRIVGRQCREEHPQDIVQAVVDASALRNVGAPVANRRHPHRETSVPPLSNVGRHPDCSTEYNPDVRTDATSGGDVHVQVKVGDRSAGKRQKVIKLAKEFHEGFDRKAIQAFDGSHQPVVHAMLHTACCSYQGKPKAKDMGDVAARLMDRYGTPERLSRWLAKVAARPGLEPSKLIDHARRTAHRRREVVA